MVLYVRMLRRHIVTDSEIADVCRRIYHRHQRVLDLIFEHRPDRLADVKAILLELMQSRDDLILDSSSKQIVRFAPVGWEGLPKGQGWTRSGRLVLFEFDNYPDRLDLNAWVGPGPEQARRRLIDLAAARQPPYRVPSRATGKNHKIIFSRRFLKPGDYENAGLADIEALVMARREEFVDRDLPGLVAPIEEAAGSIATALADKTVNATSSVLTTEAVRDR
jgi:hypothetical protein